ncbi:45 kDa calcium-binding protein-like [Branchiostoma floridae]|uniref:45 kDa calcium-binding protein n=3 Tax=Branchiostoma floridae TaxID=7739 RepID=A0A9J7MA06_BRAFL|nr:45 kDa calcium-binding protein-like [Branchiostoma floridae]
MAASRGCFGVCRQLWTILCLYLVSTVAFLGLCSVVRARPLEMKNKSTSKNAEDDKLSPPDHLDAVRMERDGHLNRDFHQEVFLGEEKDDIEQIPHHVIDDRLKEIFKRIDVDTDGLLTQQELQDWILRKTQEHFQEAEQENSKHFQEVDQNKDGNLHWDEYRLQFLESRGYDRDKIMEVIQQDTEIEMDVDDEEDLERDHDRFLQADEDPRDELLNEKEFLAFRHPEHSSSMLSLMVQEILHDLDQNGDQILTLLEFVSMPYGAKVEEVEDSKDTWVVERRQEFKEVMDTDGDGKVTLTELEAYMDPRSDQQALNEARQMIRVADANSDGKLSLAEILDNCQFFIGSKMANYAKVVHEEF